MIQSRRVVNCRQHALFRIFHYLDNFVRYPAEKIIRQASAEGANLFMLYENWRLDGKNGEFVFDRSGVVVREGIIRLRLAPAGQVETGFDDPFLGCGHWRAG